MIKRQRVAHLRSLGLQIFCSVLIGLYETRILVFFLPSTKPLVWRANVGSSHAGTCSNVQVFAALHPRLPEESLKQKVIDNMSDCNGTIETSPRFSLEISEQTGEIPHSGSAMFIFQLSLLDLSCSGSHQPTCTGAPRPGLNKLAPPPPPH